MGWGRREGGRAGWGPRHVPTPLCCLVCRKPGCEPRRLRRPHALPVSACAGWSGLAPARAAPSSPPPPEWLREETAFMAVASTTRAAAALRVTASASASLSMATRVAPSTTVCPPLGWCWMALFSGEEGGGGGGDAMHSGIALLSGRGRWGCLVEVLQLKPPPVVAQALPSCHPTSPQPWWAPPAILPASRRPGAASASRSRSCSLYTSMKAACSWYSQPCSRSLATDSRIWGPGGVGGGGGWGWRVGQWSQW